MRRVYRSLTYVANKWKDKWNNESAKAELKRLQAQLADAKDELSQTQKDREYDIRKEGYQGLSDDLNSALEDTLDEVKYNSSKQEQVISEMLNHVVITTRMLTTRLIKLSVTQALSHPMIFNKILAT